MSPFEQLLLTLAVLYLIECVAWLPRNAIVVTSWMFVVRRIRHPSTIFGNGSGGAVFLSPLPFDAAPLAALWPISVSPQAALAYVSQTIDPSGRPTQPERLVSLDEIDNISIEGKTLLIDGNPMAQIASATFTRQLGRWLRVLRAVQSPERPRLIDTALAKSMDVRRVRRRLQRFTRRAALLRILATVLFLFVFALLPTMWYTVGLATYWQMLVPTYLILHLWTVIEFNRAHRDLYPRDKNFRRKQMILMSIAPTIAMRGYDLLSRELVGNAHPLALAIAWCGRKTLNDFAGRVLRDTEYPIAPVCPVNDALAHETESAFRRQLSLAMSRALDACGINRQRLLSPLPDLDGGAKAYCPRCGAGFVRIDAVCDACGGLPAVSR